MSNDYFRFKQFTINQQACAMKVGTDGVLLGAWAEGGQKILDIGTGTGLIALMLAQRFPKAQITAIDISPSAITQAQSNISMSPFKKRIEVLPVSLQELEKKCKEGSFDCIVCNPPFFRNSLKNPDKERAIARHSETLSYQDLFHGVAHLLSFHGTFSAVIPTECSNDFITESCISGLFIVREALIKTTERKPARRHLLTFRKHPSANIERKEFTLLDSENNRSEWYRLITKDFYIGSPV